MLTMVQTCENPVERIGIAAKPGYSGLELSLSGCGGLQCLEFAMEPVSPGDCSICRIASSTLPPIFRL